MSDLDTKASQAFEEWWASTPYIDAGLTSRRPTGGFAECIFVAGYKCAMKQQARKAPTAMELPGTVRRCSRSPWVGFFDCLLLACAVFVVWVLALAALRWVVFRSL
jgi:hypothetical protein